MYGKQFVPYQVVWEITLKCNLKCIHCGSSAGRKRPEELSTKEAMKLCKDLAEIGSKQACLMGGEPFLRKDWYQLGKEIKDLGMDLLMISNGYAVDRDILSKLSRLEIYGLSFSLDGAESSTHDYIRGVKGSFDRVIKAISMSREYDLPITVITTVNRLNLKDLPRLRDFLINRDIAWQIQVAMPQGRFSRDLLISKEEFYALGLFIANLRRKYSVKELPVIGAHCFGYFSKYIPHLGLSKQWAGCQAGLSILSIKSNGDIIGCLTLPDDFIEGNIRNRSVIEIWESEDSFAYNRKFKEDTLGENCRKCKYGGVCRGGCTGVSVSLTGEPHNDPYCFYAIERERGF